jgi:hypothetical protein
MKEKIEYNGVELVNIFFEIYEDAVRIYGHRWENNEKFIFGGTNLYKITEGMKPLKVFESEESYKKYSWCKEWKKLEEKDQTIVWSMFGKDWILKEYKESFSTLKSPQKLLQSALQNFYRMGWNKECTRCGGSGNYSYNMRFGTKCFKCSGKKIQSVTPSKAEIKKFLTKYPEGILNSEHKKEIKGKGEYKLKWKDQS